MEDKSDTIISTRPRGPSPSPSYLHQEGGRGRRLLTTYRHNLPVTTIQRTIDDLHTSHRDLDLRSAGYTVFRFNDIQLESEPARVAAVLREALS